MNQITHWLDSSNVYGSGESNSQKLRSFDGGKLSSETGIDGVEMLTDSEKSNCRGISKRCFLSGNKTS